MRRQIRFIAVCLSLVITGVPLRADDTAALKAELNAAKSTNRESKDYAEAVSWLAFFIRCRER